MDGLPASRRALPAHRQPDLAAGPAHGVRRLVKRRLPAGCDERADGAGGPNDLQHGDHEVLEPLEAVLVSPAKVPKMPGFASGFCPFWPSPNRLWREKN